MATEPRLLTSDVLASLEYVRRSVLRLLIVFAVASAVAYPLAPQLLHFLALPLGAQFDGPAIVEQPDTTTVVYPGFTCRVDDAGNLLLTLHTH